MPCIGQLGARGALLLAVVAVCVSSVCAEASPDSIVAEPVAWHADGIVPERDPLAEVNARAAKEDALLSPLEEFESQEEEDDVFGAQAQLEALIESAVSNTAQDEPEPAAAGSAAGSADPFAEAQHKLEDDEKEGAQKFHEWSNKMHAAVQDANQAQDGLSKAAPGWDTDAVTDNLARMQRSQTTPPTTSTLRLRRPWSPPPRTSTRPQALPSRLRRQWAVQMRRQQRSRWNHPLTPTPWRRAVLP